MKPKKLMSPENLSTLSDTVGKFADLLWCGIGIGTAVVLAYGIGALIENSSRNKRMSQMREKNPKP